MNKVKLIIELDEDKYNYIKKQGTVPILYDNTIAMAVLNGTPLEEPFDLEGLKSDMKALNCGYPYGLEYLLDCLNKRLGVTIVERKKENK